MLKNRAMAFTFSIIQPEVRDLVIELIVRMFLGSVPALTVFREDRGTVVIMTMLLKAIG